MSQQPDTPPATAPATGPPPSPPPADGVGVGRLVGYAVAAAAVLATLGWAYWPDLMGLFDLWENEPNYSHGYLVIPAAAFMFWWLYPRGEEARRLRPSIWGWALLVALVGARFACYRSGSFWLEGFTLLPTVAALVLAFGGWTLLRRTWPAVVFLIFMYSIPPSLNSKVSLPLQRIASTSSASLLRLLGLWVMDEGNVLVIGDEQLEVAAACNGLAMFMSLSATIAATIILVPMALWKRLVLLASIVPISLLCNVLRISATAWSYHLLGSEESKQMAHDWAGLLMMPLALALVLLELAWLSWLVTEEEAVEPVSPAFLTTAGCPAVAMSRADHAGPEVAVTPETTRVWGLPMARLTRTGAAEAVARLVADGRPSYFITANLHYAMASAADPAMRPINEAAAFILADGAPLVWGSRWRRSPLPERVAGSDLIYDLCEQAASVGHRVFFLGGPPGVAEAAARRLEGLYPGLAVAGVACPPFRPLDIEEQAALVAEIRDARPDLLFVAFGQPKGERWIDRHRHELGVPVCVQVGASLEFVAGRVRRTPRWVQRLGMEWAWRIGTDPIRLGPRYARNAAFLLRMALADLRRGPGPEPGPEARAVPSPTRTAGTSPASSLAAPPTGHRG